MGQGDQSRGNILLRELSDLSTLDRSQEILDRLEILLTDYLVCVAHASQTNSSTRSLLSEDGVLGLGAWLALQSTQGDRDDIDWTIGAHPGSVIWSTLFALGLIHEKTRTNFVEAALAGFRSSASVGNFLGVAHRAKWHVTATAGTFAAASAASVSLGHSTALHQISTAQLPFGGASISIRTSTGQDSVTIYSPPGTDFQNPQEVYWRNFKWSTMVGNRLSEVEALSDSPISGESGSELWNLVKELLRN